MINPANNSAQFVGLPANLHFGSGTQNIALYIKGIANAAAKNFHSTKYMSGIEYSGYRIIRPTKQYCRDRSLNPSHLLTGTSLQNPPRILLNKPEIQPIIYTPPFVYILHFVPLFFQLAWHKEIALTVRLLLHNNHWQLSLASFETVIIS